MHADSDICHRIALFLHDRYRNSYHPCCYRCLHIYSYCSLCTHRYLHIDYHMRYNIQRSGIADHINLTLDYRYWHTTVNYVMSFYIVRLCYTKCTHRYFDFPCTYHYGMSSYQFLKPFQQDICRYRTCKC